MNITISRRKRRKFKQMYTQGLTFGEIKKQQPKALKTISHAFALQNQGPVKTVKIEGTFNVVKIKNYNYEDDSILVLENPTTLEKFTLLGDDDFITGLTIA